MSNARRGSGMSEPINMLLAAAIADRRLLQAAIGVDHQFLLISNSDATSKPANDALSDCAPSKSTHRSESHAGAGVLSPLLSIRPPAKPAAASKYGPLTFLRVVTRSSAASHGGQ